MSVSAVVLAGGMSRRLGTDKHLLRLGGRSLVQIAVDHVSSVSDDVIVVASPSAVESLAVDHARVVADDLPGRGPLSGLHAGFQATDADRVLLVACDLPFLSIGLLRYISVLAPESDAVVPQVDGELEPLVATYSRACLPVVNDLLTRDSASMRDLIAVIGARLVPEEELRRFDPKGLSWFNINTPADFDRARDLWDEHGDGPDSVLA